MKVLIIEDDIQIIEIIELTLDVSRQHFDLIKTRLGKEGIKAFLKDSPNLVILDLGLPDISGFEVLKQIREISKTPVLVLTVYDDEMSVVKALNLGADDYVVKPFRKLELIARMQSLIKRTPELYHNLPIQTGCLSLGPTLLDCQYNGKHIHLTKTEGLIMLRLMSSVGDCVTRKQLVEDIWGYSDSGSIYNLRVYVRRLRQKIEPDPKNPKIIITKSGLGYTLIPPQS